jgi:cytochrome c oxidase cbb3-type subunit 2
MNRMRTLFAGFFATFISAWLGLVLAPHIQFGGLKEHLSEDDNLYYPPARRPRRPRVPGLCRQRLHLRHSQQVRPAHQGSDLARGWAPAVARDYLNDRPVMLGTMRTGPDLTNIGHRQKDEAWHHKHLYAPRSPRRGRSCPPSATYRKQRITGAPSPDALHFDGPDAPEPGFEIVPTEAAKALVAYLISSTACTLPEAPLEE